MNHIILNLVIIISIIIGILMDKSIHDHKSYIQDTKILWIIIDIIVLLISLYFVFIKKNNLYIITLCASLFMLYKSNVLYLDHKYGSKHHLQQTQMGSIADGLIVGIALSGVFYKN